VTSFSPIIRFASVCLTAGATFLAGIPYSICACADGSADAEVTGCSQSCCNHSAGAKKTQSKTVSSCCAKGQQATVSATKLPKPSNNSQETQIDARPCAKTFSTTASPVATRPDKSNDTRFASAEFAVPISFSVACQPSAPYSVPHFWLVSRIPPPSDLVVVLQHFII